MPDKEKGTFEDKAWYERGMKTYIPPNGEMKKQFQDHPNPEESVLACPLAMLQRNGRDGGRRGAADNTQPQEEACAELRAKYGKDTAASRAKGKPDAAEDGAVKAEKSKKRRKEAEAGEDEDEDGERLCSSAVFSCLQSI